MDLPFHKVAELFPLMEGEAYDLLKADIAAHGQREPIWTLDGKIIDGRNRYRACKALGIEPKAQEWDGNGSLVEFVVSLNLHRRHLDSGQRAAVAVEMLPLLKAEAKERQRASGGDRYAAEIKDTVPVPPNIGEPVAGGGDKHVIEIKDVGPVPQKIGEPVEGPAARTVIHKVYGPYTEQPDGNWRDAEGREASARTIERWQQQGKIRERGPESPAAVAAEETGVNAKDKHAGEAVQQAARLVGSNRQYVADATAVKQADPDLFAKVKAGAVKLKDAKKKVRPNKKARLWGQLPEVVQAILGDHELTRNNAEMRAIYHLGDGRTPTEKQQQVARVLVEGKAKRVREARKLLDPSPSTLDKIKRLLPQLTAQEREELRALLATEK
jgi:hypothetical protein